MSILRGMIAALNNVTLDSCVALKGGGGALHFLHQDTIISSTSVRDLYIVNSEEGNRDGGGILCTERAQCLFRIEESTFILRGNRAPVVLHVQEMLTVVSGFVKLEAYCRWEFSVARWWSRSWRQNLPFSYIHPYYCRKIMQHLTEVLYMSENTE